MIERDQPWTLRIALSDVPEDGLHVALDADSTVRSALARIANLRDLPQLEASFDLRHKGAGGLHVTGEVSAKIGQNCVVTLEPIEQNLSEAIDLVFFPEHAQTLGDSEGEASFGMTDSEAPEPLTGGIVDLGAIATEYFLLGIDPYPRKEGAVFEAAPPTDPAADSPFAALGALKKPPATGK
jgi:uncharacterized metal-binding protein YceD (DUF177 family)